MWPSLRTSIIDWLRIRSRPAFLGGHLEPLFRRRRRRHPSPHQPLFCFHLGVFPSQESPSGYLPVSCSRRRERVYAHPTAFIPPPSFLFSSSRRTETHKGGFTSHTLFMLHCQPAHCFLFPPPPLLLIARQIPLSLPLSHSLTHTHTHFCACPPKSANNSKRASFTNF